MAWHVMSSYGMLRYAVLHSMMIDYVAEVTTETALARQQLRVPPDPKTKGKAKNTGVLGKHNSRNIIGENHFSQLMRVLSSKSTDGRRSGAKESHTRLAAERKGQKWPKRPA